MHQLKNAVVKSSKRVHRSSTRLPGLMILGGGVLLGLGQAASASFITRNLNVTLNATNSDDYNLDVDQNGTTDFTFQTAYVPDPVLTVGFDQIKFAFGTNSAAVIDSQTGDGFPAASLLVAGNTVSSTSLFSGPNDLGDLFFDDTVDPKTGNFNGKTGFVGLRFDGAGGVHYGYVQVTVTSESDPANPLNLMLGTLVYNDVAGGAISIAAVPEPASMGAAALGLFGVLARRRN